MSFRRAYELSGRPALLYNIGTASDRLRRDDEALAAFEAYLAASPDAPNRAEVEARVAVLRGRASSEVEAVAGESAPPREGPDLLWTLVAGGSSPALGAVAVGAWVAANEAYGGLERGCFARRGACTDDEIEDSGVETWVAVTNAFFVASMVAAAASVTLLVDRGSRRRWRSGSRGAARHERARAARPDLRSSPRCRRAVAASSLRARPRLPFYALPCEGERRGAMKALAEALGEVLGEARGRRVLWAAIEPIEALDAARGANRATVDALPEGDFDAVVLGASAGDLGPTARAARQRVRAGGVLAVVVPIERAGIRALTQSVLGAFQPSRRPRALEEVCAALLCAGVSPVKVIDVKGARGDAVVHGVVQSAPAIV